MQYSGPTKSDKEEPVYILNGNASPFFSISCKVSSPQALVSSIKGGEQILSSARQKKEDSLVMRGLASQLHHYQFSPY